MVTAAANLLDAQLDLLDDRVSRRPMERQGADWSDAEDLIALALETLERIRKRCQAADTGDTHLLLAYWQRWHDMGVRALSRIDALEHQGRKMEQADIFRFAVNEASMARDWDRMLAAQHRLEAGGGRSLEEIENALSHKAG